MLRGRRGPFIVAAIVAVLILIMAVLLVLPKMNEVSTARDDLAAAQAEQRTLESLLAALGEAELLAPEATAQIQEVERQIPPTADQPGFLLLVKNAAASAAVTEITLTIGSPIADAATGLTTIPVTIGGSGTYFAITEFMYSLETLPRATRASTVTVAPGGSADPITGIASSALQFQTNVVFFTTDASAGPGSQPGPSEDAAAGATTPATPPAEG